MIVGVASHRQQIDDLGLDLDKRPRKIGEDLSQVSNAALLEGCVVRNDRAATVAAQQFD
ncbi:hypothetical protein D3C73_1601950 [compost metagenome]